MCGESRYQEDADGAFTYTCPSCGAAIPHAVTNTRCVPSGVIVDRSDFSLSFYGGEVSLEDEILSWQDAAFDSLWRIEDAIDREEPTDE